MSGTLARGTVVSVGDQLDQVVMLVELEGKGVVVESFPIDNSRFTRATIPAVDIARVAWALRRVFEAAMNKPEAAPLSETSPTTKHSRSVST